MARNLLVTSALPYANGSLHIGHMVEYLQTDIWVRFEKLCGNRCLYFCADDTHGTPIMIRAKNEGLAPEKLIADMHAEHEHDFAKFSVEFDNYHTTHSPENQQLSTDIFTKLSSAGHIEKKTIEQTYCPNCDMALPDRFVKGTCPKCKTADQYGDSCNSCGATYQPIDLIDSYCSNCGKSPERQESIHYFFKLSEYSDRLKSLIADGLTDKSIANKLDEWFDSGLRDWDISRDGPYFGFKIPGEANKYFYVWLDAPVGYMASAKNYCDKNDLDFAQLWNDSEIYHFIGKDITYFHALFWPAMLIGSGYKVPDKLCIHGFLTVDGLKMSKSRGTFIKASTFANHLEPEHLRYYYACKLSGGIDDIDLNLSDFSSRINSDLVGKYANLASRCGPMLSKKLDSKLGTISEQGLQLLNEMTSAKTDILLSYENRNFAKAMRQIMTLADLANRYVETQAPWQTIKEDLEQTRETLTVALNAFRILTIYLKPVLPNIAEQAEQFLNISPLDFDSVENFLENHTINKFQKLAQRVNDKEVQKMLDESKTTESPTADDAPVIEPIADECTIDDFAKVDLRIAKIENAQAVEGANKLVQLTLDIGGIKKNVFAGIAKAYKPEDLTGKLVVCVANLKPRKMQFGISEGMILACGSGGSDLFLITAEAGVKPGQRVS